MATTDVECLLGREGILLAIDDNDAVALTAVDDTEFAVVEEILILDAWVYVETEVTEVLEFQGFVDRHGTAKDEAVVVRIRQINLVSHHNLLHHETLAERLGVVVLDILRMAGGLELYVLLAVAIQ